MKLKYLLIAIAGLGMFASCESDEPSLKIAEYKKPTTFVLNTPQFANGVYDLLNAETVNFTFSQPDYGYAAACDYTVEVSPTETFESSSTVATVFHKCDIFVKASELATAACVAYNWIGQSDIDEMLNASETKTIPLYIRVKSKITNSVITDSEITSNVIKINTVPYFSLPPVEMPTTMYMAGAFCGWEWANAAEMVPIHSNPDKFWVIRYVEAGAGFSFNGASSADGNEAVQANTTIVSTVDGVNGGADSDGKLTVDKAGWYIFGIQVALDGRDFVYTVNVFPADVYVYGTCTGLGDNGWTDMPEWKFEVPATADGDFVSPALATSGELRICIHPMLDNAAWAGDWWHTEFIFFDGKIAYRGSGDDQAHVQAAAGQKAHLNFVTGKATLK